MVMTSRATQWPRWWWDDGHDLPLTGERTLPGIARERYWFARHVAGYELAASLLTTAAPSDTLRNLAQSRQLNTTSLPLEQAEAHTPRRVLDAGSGEGYGAALLASAAHHVVGLDMDANAVAHASTAYAAQAAFAVGEVTTSPFASGSFDAVVSSQVIEHLWDVDGWLEEVARLVGRGGTLVVITPNRHTFTPGSDEPHNPFHVTEFAPDELAARLARRFTEVAVAGIAHGPHLAATERARGTTLPAAQADAAPEAWPAWLRETVAGCGPGDFVVGPAEGSLDLVAVGSAPAHPAAGATTR